jgi:Lon protease-like protein
MDEIGLFPLGMVLLPMEQVPLHIFEPRYQELVAECLGHDREFGLVYADEDGLQAIGTRAAVTEVVDRFDDGRLDIVVEGGDRFRLAELTTGRSFQTGRVEPLVDVPDPAPATEVARAMELFDHVLAVTGSEVNPPEMSLSQLSFALAGRFELAPALKQDLLRRTSERERLEVVCEILEKAGAAAERHREIQERAAGNGKVDTA